MCEEITISFRNVYTVRMKKKISLRKLSAMTGLSKTTIWDIENDLRNPTIYVMCLIAVALDVDVRELFSYHRVLK